MSGNGIGFQPRIDSFANAASLNREAVRDSARQSSSSPDLVIVNDPTLLMAEMAEELGFLKSEELAGSQEIEGDNEEAFEDLINNLIRESLKASKTPEAQLRQDAEALRARLLQANIASGNGHGLDEAIRRFTGGSSQQGLALLAELIRLAQSDPDLQRLGYGRNALEAFAQAHEAGLTSALNIADVLDRAPTLAEDSAQRILALYEQSIDASQSVLQTFQRLGQSEGIATLNDWRAFLTEAVAADLAKQTSGGEKVHLQLILEELKGFRTFNTLSQGLERLMKILPREDGPQTTGLMQSTLDYIEQPLREFPNFEAWVQKLVLARKILFFQNFRNLLKSLPDDAYASPEQKAGTLMPLQKRVDELTWSEDV
jgi:hypothetical protein